MGVEHGMSGDEFTQAEQYQSAQSLGLVKGCGHFLGCEEPFEDY